MISKNEKRLFGYGFLIFFLILILGPLFLFSDILPYSGYDKCIKSQISVSF